jgi:DNA-binding transcriptional LysR family regulator
VSDSLRRATLRQLQIFLIAAEKGSFARAASELHLTHPAISMQMAQLSDVAGQPLFEKMGRTVRLTEAGHVLLPYAHRIVHTVREAGDALDGLKGPQRAGVRIALVATTQYFMPRLLAMFRTAHKGIEVNVTIGSREQVIRQLENREVELAIMGRPPGKLVVSAQPFAEHPHGIIAAPQHRLAGCRLLDPKLLINEKFIAREPGSGTRYAMEQYFAEHGIEPLEVQEMHSNESIKQSVMAAMGLAFISLHTVILEHQTGLVVLLDAKGLPVTRNWYVLHLQDQALSRAAQALKGFILEEGATHMHALLRGLGAEKTSPASRKPRR